MLWNHLLQRARDVFGLDITDYVWHFEEFEKDNGAGIFHKFDKTLPVIKNCSRHYDDKHNAWNVFFK